MLEYDEYVNQKIAEGLKKVMRMVIERLDLVVDAKCRVVVQEEMAIQMIEFRNSMSKVDAMIKKLDSYKLPESKAEDLISNSMKVMVVDTSKSSLGLASTPKKPPLPENQVERTASTRRTNEKKESIM